MVKRRPRSSRALWCQRSRIMGALWCPESPESPCGHGVGFNISQQVPPFRDSHNFLMLTTSCPTFLYTRRDIHEVDFCKRDFRYLPTHPPAHPTGAESDQLGTEFPLTPFCGNLRSSVPEERSTIPELRSFLILRYSFIMCRSADVLGKPGG